MKAFWWFKENKIAGMARPGFNAFHFNDLPFDEAILLSWVAKHPNGVKDFSDFEEHLTVYAPKTFRFYGLDDLSGPEAIAKLREHGGRVEVGQRMLANTQVFSRLEFDPRGVFIEYCGGRLAQEVQELKKRGIQRVITLTEHHHGEEVLSDHFTTHHIPILDLHAPQAEQAHILKEIFVKALNSGETLAVHCMAGIGRTSTMILAAHILMGHDYHTIEAQLRRTNPAFSLSESQREFIRSLKDQA